MHFVAGCHLRRHDCTLQRNAVKLVGKNVKSCNAREPFVGAIVMRSRRSDVNITRVKPLEEQLQDTGIT
jgi:hypothetical protein